MTARDSIPPKHPDQQASLSANDWDLRYQTGDIPWDMGTVSPPLVVFHREGRLPAARRVLVPGCGGGHEVGYLARAGYEAVGVDYSPRAVEMARRQHGLGATATFVCRDMLIDAPVLGEPLFDWAFDQTFFCAILPVQRHDYGRAMSRWLRPGGELWALSFRVSTPGGPPFDSTPAEFIGLLTAAGFEWLESRPLQSESHPARKGRETLVRMRKSEA